MDADYSNICLILGTNVGENLTFARASLGVAHGRESSSCRVEKWQA